MTEDEGIWSRSGSFVSLHGDGNRLIEELIQTMKYRGWTDPEQFAVNLAVVEAINNAVCHGNKNDPNKQYFISCSVLDSRVDIEIRDEGEGFNYDSLPDPRADGRIDAPRGRGILLIKGFMSGLQYNAVGNGLVMHKMRSSVAVPSF